MLFHGISKISHGVDGIGKMLVGKGLPYFIAYGVYVGEVVAPILIIIGLLTRPAALVFAFNMMVAIWMAHTKDIFVIKQGGAWGIELQMFYLLGALAIFFLGSGSLAVSRGRGRFD